MVALISGESPIDLSSLWDEILLVIDSLLVTLN